MAAMTGSSLDRACLDRRAFVAAGLAGGFALAACSRPAASTTNTKTAAIDSTEAARPHTGRTVTASLTPRQGTTDLGGINVQTLV